MRRWLCEVQHSYFVIRMPQTMVLFVIRKLLSISHGFTKYELRNQWRASGLRITNYPLNQSFPDPLTG